MALRLTIRKGNVEESGNRSRWTFGVNGGRIGRAHDNDWVLVDPERFISAHHAEIEHRAGEWWLCDTSTNGTFVNGSARPLGRGGRHRLADGDRIRMGSLEAVAEISGGNDFLTDADDLDLSETALDASFEVRSLLSNESTGGRPRPADAYGQPLPRSAEPKPSRKSKEAAAPASAGQATPAPRPATGESDLWPGIVAFCQGAGLDPLTLPPDKRAGLLREAGLAMREVVLGLMELAHARAEFVRETGMDTGRRSTDATSPLMQVRAVEDALAQMLTAGGPQATRAVDEVRTQFARARHHQQSTLVALREAVAAMLGGLDPEELEQQFGGTTRGPASPEVQARYWSLYRQMFRSLAPGGEGGLPAVFQEAFARAYQELEAMGLRQSAGPDETS